MAKELVVVESPAKARTLSRFLGRDYLVKASLGHVRDLPEWRLGVNISKGFRPFYLVVPGKDKVVKEIQDAAKDARAVYLATDPDREGEAISWHLVEAAGLDKLSVPKRRVVFHEITEDAVKGAFRHPRKIDMDLVNSQQARRILDRLVGYQLSPLLAKKLKEGLSAGRVQSVALRMVVEREREIQGFVPREFWTITAELAKHQAPQGNGRPPQSFLAELVHHKGEKGKLDLPNEERARAVLADLDGAAYHVAKVSKKDGQRRPPPPFITSTLQQEAWRKLRFSARQTMLLAQQLYEGLSVGNEGSVGLITYMRTDSTHLATAAVAEARSYIERSFGKEHLPEHPRVYTRKVKGAQEAHEAIRPTSIHRTPESVRPYLAREQFRLYELVWQRMVACQMANATFEATTVEVDARSRRSRNVYLFRAVGTIQTFAGFLALYQEGRDETNGTGDDMAAQGPLPPLQVNDALDCLGLKPEQHFTKPPPRYTEATLVKALEDNGIGRPSTYASILSTLLDREYVKKDDGRLVPQEIGGLVNDLLVAHFPSIIDLQFTAKMEEELDQIARGERSWEQFLAEFYAPFSHDLQKAETAIPDEAANQTCDKCSKPMVIRVGRFGRFMACSGFPECKNTRPLPKEEAAEQPSDEVCDKCGKPMVVKSGRYGKFLSCTGFPVCKNSKPLLVKTGAQCPRCGGDLVERRAARAKGRGPRTFYGCVNYPTCDFTTPNRPLPTPCPECGGLLTTRNGRSTSCTKCSYRGEVAELSKEPTAVEA